MKVSLPNSTIAKKLIIGLSGLMLCGFLVAHLAGNMLFYVPDGYASYNDYAHAIHNTLEDTPSTYRAAVQRGRERLQGKDEPAEVA